ncbi:MAG TPA: cofactor-independent phosphoglycerate mutase [Candidatus Monoglobus merdigallinarum]|uniref:Cofactor-independent phosphoglycerate mutase n=1 Tax=Candidatus Monoglobus merdigallinarum TaxID=2838698 RepID=A0A9D1PQ72_9FIRM|nr:cofactor-independent phosphoglycerate mutase [Candidatus Monoglobus merdigallinarum]
MKYVVILADGAADTPVKELGGKTPLEAASKPVIDALAKNSEVGMVRTVPDGLPPGSDVANLAVFGYDPTKYYTGRSPLEAVSMNVPLKLSDTTFRTNVVTLSDAPNYEDKVMLDYSSDEITTEEARELIKYINENLGTDEYEFFGGFSYRHLMVWHNKKNDFTLTPPHDISDRVIGEYLPKDETILALMKKSYELLENHPVNVSRRERGLNPANSIWIWGNGTKPDIPTYAEKFGIKGAVVSAVDLIKGIGCCAGLDVLEVEGATGNINTNFDGKAEAAVNALKSGNDFVYIHLEAPDEAGHRHEIDNKVRAIELIDSKIAAPVLNYLKGCGEDYSVLIMPDHPTPLATRTHSSAPIPYLLYSSKEPRHSGCGSYTEAEAQKTGLFVENGYTLINKLFGI